MTHVSTPPSVVSIYVYKLINWFDELAYNIKRSRNVATTINELSRLSDAELRDIGISRGEIYDIAYNAYPKG